MLRSPAGDDIVGFVTRGFGVSVHKSDCPNVKKADPERIVSVRWAGTSNGYFAACLEITAISRIDLILDITSVLTSMRVVVHSMTTKTMTDGCTKINIVIDVHGLDHLQTIAKKLEKIQDVINIKRSVQR